METVGIIGTASGGADTSINIPVSPGRFVTISASWPLSREELEQFGRTFEVMSRVLLDEVVAVRPEGTPETPAMSQAGGEPGGSPALNPPAQPIEQEEVERGGNNDPSPSLRAPSSVEAFPFRGEREVQPSPPIQEPEPLPVYDPGPEPDLFDRPPSDANEEKPKRKPRDPQTCPDCNAQIVPQGMENHRRFKHRGQHLVDASPPVPLFGKNPELICRFCETECGSVKSRTEHEEQYCEKRLTERSSTLHVHHWLCGPPQGSIVLGQCKTCGVQKEFPSDHHSGLSRSFQKT